MITCIPALLILPTMSLIHTFNLLSFIPLCYIPAISSNPTPRSAILSFAVSIILIFGTTFFYSYKFQFLKKSVIYLDSLYHIDSYFCLCLKHNIYVV